MENFDILWVGLLLITLNLIILTLLGNATVIVCMFHFKRLRTAANYIVVSLAATDILLAFCFPLTIFKDWTGTDSNFGLLFNHVQATASGASIITISIIAYDRYTAVSKPLLYKTEMTKRKTFCFIGFAWFYSAIVSWTPLLVDWLNCLSLVKPFTSSAFLQSTYTLQLITIFLPSCCAIFFCYINIYCIARHHSLAIAALEMSLKSNRQTICRNTKYSKTISSIIGTFLSLWLPFQIGVLLTNIANIHITYAVCKTLHYLSFFNSILNPWMYALKTSDFQSAFKQLYECIFKTKKVERFINRQATIMPDTGRPLKSVTAVLSVHQTALRHGYQTQKFLLTNQEMRFGFTSNGKWSPRKLSYQLAHTSQLQAKSIRLSYPKSLLVRAKSFIT